MITGALSIGITTIITVLITTGTATGVVTLPGYLTMPKNSWGSLGSIIEVIIMHNQIVLLL